MRTLADFRRTATEGSRWRVINFLRPEVSGVRVITKAQTNALRYDAVKANGAAVGGWLRLPRANEVRIDGNAVHFLHGPDGDQIAFTWIFVSED